MTNRHTLMPFACNYITNRRHAQATLRQDHARIRKSPAFPQHARIRQRLCLSRARHASPLFCFLFHFLFFFHPQTTTFSTITTCNSPPIRQPCCFCDRAMPRKKAECPLAIVPAGIGQSLYQWYFGSQSPCAAIRSSHMATISSMDSSAAVCGSSIAAW